MEVFLSILLPILIFLFLLGFPPGLLIWFVVKRLKTGVFLWKKFILGLFFYAILAIGLVIVSTFVLTNISKYFGLPLLNERDRPNPASSSVIEAQSSNGVIILPDLPTKN